MKDLTFRRMQPLIYNIHIQETTMQQRHTTSLYNFCTYNKTTIRKRYEIYKGIKNANKRGQRMY